MVNKSLYIVFILLLVLAVKVFLQQNNQISEKQTELERLKTEILSLEQELKKKTASEKESFTAVENYNKQNFLLNRVITKLREEEKLKQNEVNRSQQQIKMLGEEIKSLQKNYSRYLVAIYKYGRLNEWASIFDSESVRQAFLRLKYLQKFSSKRQKDLEVLELRIAKLEETKVRLDREKKEKTILADKKKEEEKQLAVKLNERRKILNSIRNDKAALRKEIDAKRQAELQIKAHITKLIEEAELKRKLEAERLAREKNLADKTSDKLPVTEKVQPPPKTTTIDIDLSTANFASFSALKGKMNWPVQNGKIVRKFGESRNVQLNTVTLNYGVDIKASNDMNVKSVAEGIVSVIDWIPGYGSVIIITHKEDYRTVYSHLAEIFVKEGDRVKQGSVIAKVGESLEGFVLHFEIWNSRNNQNPEVWLARK